MKNILKLYVILGWIAQCKPPRYILYVSYPVGETVKYTNRWAIDYFDRRFAITIRYAGGNLVYAWPRSCTRAGGSRGSTVGRVVGHGHVDAPLISSFPAFFSHRRFQNVKIHKLKKWTRVVTIAKTFVNFTCQIIINRLLHFFVVTVSWFGLINNFRKSLWSR